MVHQGENWLMQETRYFVVRYTDMMGVNSLLLSFPWQKMP